jgi:hypothetical protein
MSAIVKGIRCLPSTDRAARSEGRRLISLRGGKRGPAWVRRCRALEAALGCRDRAIGDHELSIRFGSVGRSSRRATALKGLDDDHAAAAARTGRQGGVSV